MPAVSKPAARACSRSHCSRLAVHPGVHWLSTITYVLILRINALVCGGARWDALPPCSKLVTPSLRICLQPEEEIIQAFSCQVG